MLIYSNIKSTSIWILGMHNIVERPMVVDGKLKLDQLCI